MPTPGELRGAARLAASASPQEAAAAMRWLRAVLEEEARNAVHVRRETEVLAQLEILSMHGVAATDDSERRVWHVRAKCVGESWRVYTDGENVVEAPCRHVRLLARAYAGCSGFPEVLRVP